MYLARVLDRFPKEYQSSAFFELLKLYKDEVLPILTERHSAVHTFTLKAKYYWGVMEHGNKDMGKLEALQNEKDSYPDLFRKQLKYMYKGFELVLKLVSELPNENKNTS